MLNHTSIFVQLKKENIKVNKFKGSAQFFHCKYLKIKVKWFIRLSFMLKGSMC